MSGKKSVKVRKSTCWLTTGKLSYLNSSLRNVLKDLSVLGIVWLKKSGKGKQLARRVCALILFLVLSSICELR